MISHVHWWIFCNSSENAIKSFLLAQISRLITYKLAFARGLLASDYLSISHMSVARNAVRFHHNLGCLDQAYALVRTRSFLADNFQAAITKDIHPHGLYACRFP